MNVKRRFIGLVATIAFVATGGIVVNTAVAVDELMEFAAGSETGIRHALELMQDLNDLRQSERTPLTPQQIADANNLEEWRIQSDTADGSPVPPLQVNWDLMKWAQTRADELIAQGQIDGHLNMTNGKPDWYEYGPGQCNLIHSDKYQWVQQGTVLYGSQYFGPEALYQSFSSNGGYSGNAVASWASELETSEQGYGHYLTEVSPLADIAGIGVAVKNGVTIVVLEIGNNYRKEGKTQTVEDAIKEATPKPQPQSVEPVTVTVAEGIAPSLPNTVKVTYTDGAVKELPVTWDSPDWTTQQPGDVTLTGTIEGVTTLTATATVTVQAKQVSSVALSASSLTVDSTNTGDISDALNTVTATVSYDNGTTDTNQAITWNALTGEQSDIVKSREGGSFELTGSVTINGTNYPVAITLNIKPATVTEVQTTFSDIITVVVGTDPQLPQTVTVKYSNGDVDTLPVRWNMPAGGFGTAGEYTLSGVIEDRAEQATLTVHVVEATITGVTNPEAITVDSGTSKDKLVLPSTVNATLSNGKTAVVPVDWNALTDEQSATLASRKGGAFTINGTVQGFGKSATITVFVTPATAMGVGFGDDMASTTNLTVESGADADSLALPKTAQVKWSNGDVTEETVSWAALTDEQKAILSDRRGGTFEVIGSVSGLKTRAVNNLVAVVTVRNADALSIADDGVFAGSRTYVTTDPWEVPELPKTAQVKWSNGDVTKEPVTWETIDPIQTSQEGATFTVRGSISISMQLPNSGSYGALILATAVVTVNQLTQPLKDAVAKAESLSADDYTEESWKAVSDALDYAKSVLTAERATAQEKTEARERLEEAIDNLRPAHESSRPTVPENPDDSDDDSDRPNVPENPDGQDAPQDSQGSVTPQNPGQTQLPNQNQQNQENQNEQIDSSGTANGQSSTMPATGAVVTWCGVVVMMMVATAAIIAVAKRRNS